MSLNVGIIGLGIMGGAFAKNLIDSGLQVSGFDIIEANIQALTDLGGLGVKSPKAVD